MVGNVEIVVGTNVVVPHRVQRVDRGCLNGHVDHRRGGILGDGDRAAHCLEASSDTTAHQVLGAEADEGVHGVDLVDTSLGHQRVVDHPAVVGRGLGHTPLLAGMVP